MKINNERREKPNWSSFSFHAFNLSSGVGDLEVVIKMPEAALLGRQKDYGRSVAAAVVVEVVWGGFGRPACSFIKK